MSLCISKPQYERKLYSSEHVSLQITRSEKNEVQVVRSKSWAPVGFAFFLHHTAKVKNSLLQCRIKSRIFIPSQISNQARINASKASSCH